MHVYVVFNCPGLYTRYWTRRCNSVCTNVEKQKILLCSNYISRLSWACVDMVMLHPLSNLLHDVPTRWYHPPLGAYRITSRPTASHCPAPCAARPRSCRRRVWRRCRTTSSLPTWWTCCSGRRTAAARRPLLSTISLLWLQADCSPAPTMGAT